MGDEARDDLKERFNTVLREARLRCVQTVEDVLPIYENVYTNDLRPRKAVEAARAIALGERDSAIAELDAARLAAQEAGEHDSLLYNDPSASDEACVMAEAASAVALAAEWLVGGYHPPFVSEEYAAKARRMAAKAKVLAEEEE